MGPIPTSIVVVDDMPETVRAITTLISRDRRFKVVATGRNGQEAIDLFDRLRPDIITMCIRMPVMDGIMATSEIRARHPDAKIVVITVGAEGQQLTQLNKAGAATVLLKPITFDELIPALLKVASAPPSEAAPTDAA